MDLIYSSSYYLYSYNPIALGFNYLFPTSVDTYIKNQQLIRKPTSQNIDNYELIMIDMDGVIRNSTKRIGLADMVFNKLNESNKNYVIITNECRKEPKLIRQDLKLMRMNIPDNIPIISASQLVKKQLMKLVLDQKSNPKNFKEQLDNSINLNTTKRIGVVGCSNQFNYYKKSFKKHKNVKFYWIENNYIPDNLDFIVIGSIDNNSNLHKNFNKSLQWLMNNLSATLIISCSDLQNVENLEKITHYTPIMFLKELETRVNKKDKSINFNTIYLNSEKNKTFDPYYFKIEHEQIIMGKPHADFMINILKYYKIIDDKVTNLDEIGSLKKKVLMIGDNLNTDIKLSEKINCDSALVLSGVTTPKDLMNIHNTYRGGILINSINYIVPEFSQLFT
jgi:ribonucleotide monophosphatase NagD (HAD superfamily)